MGAQRMDLAGQVYGRLTVLSFAGRTASGSTWRCLCDCGNAKIVTSSNLRSGATKSCGCLAKECSAERSVTHGMTGSVEHRTWTSMLSRCRNPKDHNFRNYGARGIRVCDRWTKFENFFADMGKRPNNCSLDRIDNEKGYGPDNCRWAVFVEQASNKRTNHFLTLEGETKTISQWARATGISKVTIRARLRIGWDTRRTLTTPVGQYVRKKTH